MKKKTHTHNHENEVLCPQHLAELMMDTAANLYATAMTITHMFTEQKTPKKRIKKKK